MVIFHFQFFFGIKWLHRHILSRSRPKLCILRKKLCMLQLHSISKSNIASLEAKICLNNNFFQKMLKMREAFKKIIWNFPYFPKPTHPTHQVWKKNKITWSKNHFWVKISILAKNYFSPLKKNWKIKIFQVADSILKK